MTHKEMLRIGGLLIKTEEAQRYAREYLTSGKGYSYPSYDRYDAAHALGPLNDADLLAPVLLNVGRTYSIGLYEALQAKVPFLQQVLDQIPHNLRLEDADPGVINILGELFSVLDGEGVAGARGTVLSKVLHRKRPGLIPLYDRVLHSVYVGPAPHPVQGDPNRSWKEFFPLYASALKHDLKTHREFWEEVAALSQGPRITTVRALDIVAWKAGQKAGTSATEVDDDD